MHYNERQDLNILAAYLRRSQGDTLRILLRNAVQEVSQASKINSIENNELSGNGAGLGSKNG